MRFPHWQFLESLDDELRGLSRCIEFTRDNFQTYSVELARLYLSVCSEIDVVAKLLCTRIKPAAQPKDISGYRKVITARYRHFTQLRVETPLYGLEWQPWTAWAQSTNPAWWKSYNNVKHERDKHYREANLGNVLESSAGLLVMLVYFHQPELYSKERPLQPDFSMLRIERQYAHVLRWGFDYSLPDFGKPRQ